MRIFRKYEFTNEAAANTKIDALGIDSEGNQTHGHSIVRLGHLETTPAVYNDNEGIDTPAVLTSTYHVDVLWKGDPDESWADNVVWCKPLGVHSFGSASAIDEWIIECKAQRPDLFPEAEVEE